MDINHPYKNRYFDKPLEALLSFSIKLKMKQGEWGVMNPLPAAVVVSADALYDIKT